MEWNLGDQNLSRLLHLVRPGIKLKLCRIYKNDNRLHANFVGWLRHGFRPSQKGRCFADDAGARDLGANWHFTIEAHTRRHGEINLRGTTLYSKLRPYGMCTMASVWANVGRVVYGAEREHVHPMYFEARHVDTLDTVPKAYRDDIQIGGGRARRRRSALP